MSDTNGRFDSTFTTTHKDKIIAELAAQAIESIHDIYMSATFAIQRPDITTAQLSPPVELDPNIL